MLKGSHLCHLVVETEGQVRAEDSCLNSWGGDKEGHCSSFNYGPNVFTSTAPSWFTLNRYVCINVYVNIWQETSQTKEDTTCVFEQH